MFGAGAEAGVIRYITNEPKLDVTEGNVKAGYGVTAHGDPNSDATAVLNLPLIEGTMAVRVVIYDDHRGGYIDNVPATFTRKNTDIGIHYANYPGGRDGRAPNGLPAGSSGYCVPPGSPSHQQLAISRATTSIRSPTRAYGPRLLYKFNEDWNVLVTQSYQDMESQGVFYQQPNASDGAPLSPLEVTLFNPAYDKDKFESTAWTVNGKLGDIKAVYTGGYLDRNVDQAGDYTNYSRGFYADYYQCYGPASGHANPCPPPAISPSATWHSNEHNEHHAARIALQHAGRLASARHRRRLLRGQQALRPDRLDVQEHPGVHRERRRGHAGQHRLLVQCRHLPGHVRAESRASRTTTPRSIRTSSATPNRRRSSLSVDFDIIPKVLTITARHAPLPVRELHAGQRALELRLLPGRHARRRLPRSGLQLQPRTPQNLSDTESGFKSRGNLTWHITPDAMVYYTFSQGFRPGGFNQNGGALHAYGPGSASRSTRFRARTPSDNLTNNEIGWKTEFFDHRLQWNGAVYRENWNNVQIEFFNPGRGRQPFLRHQRPELPHQGHRDLAGRPGHQRPHAAVRGILEPEPADELAGPDRQQPGQRELRQADHAGLRRQFGTDCTPVSNPFGPIGAPSANAPPLQFSVRARYEWSFDDYTPVRAGRAPPTRPFLHAGGIESDDPAGRRRSPPRVAGSRFPLTRPTMPRSASPRMPGGSTSTARTSPTPTPAPSSAPISSSSSRRRLRPRVIGGSFGYKF